MSTIPVEKTLEQVRTDLFDKIGTVQQEGWLPQNLNLNRGPVRGLIEMWAWGLYQLYSFLASILQQAFPDTSTGAWLDIHCRQLGLQRMTATKAKGIIYFTRNGTDGNVPVAKGRIIKTRPDGMGRLYRFVTTEDAVLPDGHSEVGVAVEAEEYGREANVTAGMITEIATAIPGIDAVENRVEWLLSEGTDKEDDGSLQERYRLAWMDVNGATKYAYESWARGINGVIAVKIMDNHPRGQGTVDVIVRGTAGQPTVELIEAVDAVVQENRPINDDVLVRGPDPVDVVLEADLELTDGNPSAIIAEAEDRVRALFLDPSPVPGIEALQIGQDLTLDLLRATIMAVTGVKCINWTSPALDIAVSNDGLARLESLTLTTTWASEL